MSDPSVTVNWPAAPSFNTGLLLYGYSVLYTLYPETFFGTLFGHEVVTDSSTLTHTFTERAGTRIHWEVRPIYGGPMMLNDYVTHVALKTGDFVMGQTNPPTDVKITGGCALHETDLSITLQGVTQDPNPNTDGDYTVSWDTDTGSWLATFIKTQDGNDFHFAVSATCDGGNYSMQLSLSGSGIAFGTNILGAPVSGGFAINLA